MIRKDNANKTMDVNPAGQPARTLGLLLALLLFTASSALAETPECGATLLRDTTLDADMNCPGPALRLSGKDSKKVTLDCAGHAIATTRDSAVVASGVSGITIKNCEISTSAAFAHGIFAENIENSAISTNGINTAGVGARGIDLQGSKHNKIVANTIHSSGDTDSSAIRLSAGSNKNILRNNNLLANSGYTIAIESADKNSIQNNTLISPLGYLSASTLRLQGGGLTVDKYGNIYSIEKQAGFAKGYGRYPMFFGVDPASGQQTWSTFLYADNFNDIVEFGFEALDVPEVGAIKALPSCCQPAPMLFFLGIDWAEPFPLHLPDGSGHLTGLDAIGNLTMLATSVSGELFEIDMLTGNATLIGRQSIGWSDLAVHPTDGKAYAISLPGVEISNSAHLYEIDISTGQTVGEIGDTGDAKLSDMDFGLDGILYGNNGSLVTISTADASVTPVGSAGFGPDRFDPWPHDNLLRDNFFKTGDGSVRFPETITLPEARETEISSELVDIGANRVTIDSAVLPFLDEPARITLDNLTGSYRNLLIDPEDDGTYLPCAPPKCKFVSFFDGSLVFDVKGFSSYSSEENTAPTLEFVASVTRAQVKALQKQTGVSDKTVKKLKSARKLIGKGLKQLGKEKPAKAFAKFARASSYLAKTQHELDHSMGLVDALAESVNAEAQAAIDQAIATGGISKFVIEAQELMTTAQLLLDEDRSEEAIRALRKAWKRARKGFKYTIGGTLEGLTGGSLLLQNNGGDDLEVSANGSFSFVTPQGKGTDYRVSILAQPHSPHHDCTVKKARGKIESGDIDNVLVNCSPVPSAYVYVGNLFAYSTTAFSMNPADGALTEIFPADITDWGATSIAIDPTGRFVYQANHLSDDNTVNSLSIDQDSGALTTTGVISIDDFPDTVAVDPSGRFVYAANSESDDVTAFAIDLASGVLSEIGSEVAAGDAPGAITVHPGGLFAYVTNEESDDITTFGIDPVSGALSEIGTEIAAGDAPRSISIDSTGRFAYVVNFGSNTVTRFAIDPVSGALGAPMTQGAAGTGPQSIAILGGSH